ncbi:MAG: hypothetical protein LBV17_10565 [Treponema sp.]|nr:hypothetical protein [Treponema sp.]
MRFLVAVLLSVSVLGCMTQNIQQFLMPNGVTMYFLQPTQWRGGGIYAEIDFNYKTKEETDVICNISIIDKKGIPKGISAMTFTGDNISFRLTELKVLFAESNNNKIRITSNFNRDEFIQFMRREEIYFEITMNDKTEKLLPSKEFIRLKTNFINDLEWSENGILNATHH